MNARFDSEEVHENTLDSADSGRNCMGVNEIIYQFCFDAIPDIVDSRQMSPYTGFWGGCNSILFITNFTVANNIFRIIVQNDIKLR